MVELEKLKVGDEVLCVNSVYSEGKSLITEGRNYYIITLMTNSSYNYFTIDGDDGWPSGRIKLTINGHSFHMFESVKSKIDYSAITRAFLGR